MIPAANSDVVVSPARGRANNFVSLPTGLCIHLHAQRVALPAILEASLVFLALLNMSNAG